MTAPNVVQPARTVSIRPSIRTNTIRCTATPPCKGTTRRVHEPIYVKLERDQFYALFGDYDTGLTMTELSRYSRQLTGVKSEMKSDHFDYTLFASRNDQAFVKDEIRGDGTSGLYHLSRKNIVLNSETVVIETRDRYRSEVILSSQPLSRFLDYSIDYDTGTIFFKSPVFNTDANFNPIFIVVRYEIIRRFRKLLYLRRPRRRARIEQQGRTRRHANP